MTRYGMAIDKKRCVACNRCAMACKVEHNLPNDVLWNCGVSAAGDKMLIPEGEYPSALSMDCYTFACQHCDEPTCVAACPTGASQKREDGIVWVDYAMCIGCESCMRACPYQELHQGVRQHVVDPQYQLDFKMGDAAVADIVDNTVSKCTFCIERIDRGEQPRCASVCFCNARTFGDLDDPASEISQLLAFRDYEQMLADAGTGPNLYYLV